MKTAVFYSYKGGQGRTTTLANLASCLYRLKKNVVMLDMDIECPGLPPKFGISAFAENDIVAQKGGIVDYLVDAISNGFSTSELQKRVIGTDLLVSGADPSGQGRGSTGSLSLIATGRVCESYFRRLRDPIWDSRIDRGPFFAGGKQLATLEALRLAIQDLEPAPDYLLVDLSSGLTRLGTSLLTAWTAPTLLFTSLDLESLDGTRHMLNHLEATPDRHSDMGRPRQEIEAYPVISRLSAFIPQAEVDSLRAKAAMALFDSRDQRVMDKISLTCSDPELEKESKLRIPLYGQVTNVRLVHDYFALVARIFPECAGTAGFTTVDALMRYFNVSKRTEEQHKIFVLPNSQGVMFNMSDGQRNVSFKVNTFLSMIDDIHAGLLADYAESKLAIRASEGDRVASSDLLDNDANIMNPILETKLYDAGMIGGARFGKSLMEEVWKDKKPESLQSRVEEWCDFDSAVGFGLLSCPSIEFVEGRPVSGQIRIRDNFLTSTRRSDQRRLCPLLSGYIAGVLEALVADKKVRDNDRLYVRHSEDECMQFHHDLDHCTFLIATEQDPQASIQKGENR